MTDVSGIVLSRKASVVPLHAKCVQNSMTTKVSIRFYKDSKVRAVWDDEQNKWFFSVLDIIGAINEQEDYQKNHNYWKYLKAKLKKEQSELVSVTTQLKLLAPFSNPR